MVYELNGEMFEKEADYLRAVEEEYKTGDRQLALDSLEEHGFDLSDINV